MISAHVAQVNNVPCTTLPDEAPFPPLPEATPQLTEVSVFDRTALMASETKRVAPHEHPSMRSDALSAQAPSSTKKSSSTEMR